jgi:hypothetical protein
MIATCKFSRSAGLADHQRGRFADLDQEYALTPGRGYVVAAIGVWETILQVLVQDDDRLPSWCPAGLFEIPPQPVPDGWLLGLCDGISTSGTELWTRWVIKCGYPELVENERHSDLLLERDPDALAIFERELRRLTEQAS